MATAFEKYPHLHAAKKRHIDRGPLAFGYLCGELTCDEVTGYEPDRSAQLELVTRDLAIEMIAAMKKVIKGQLEPLAYPASAQDCEMTKRIKKLGKRIAALWRKILSILPWRSSHAHTA